MKRFRAFLNKEFLHIFRDVRTMMILFLIPVFQVLIFGYVIKNEVKDAKVAVLDFSGDVMTAALVAKLDAANDIKIVKTLYSYEEIEASFKANEIKAAIVFESDFAKKFNTEKTVDLQIILDASDPNLANLLNSYISAIANNYARDKNIGAAKINVSVEPRMLYNENLVSAYMFVPGTMALILMVITALMSSISIVKEKEMGTMEILLVSPLKPIQIIFGKLAPYAILSIINAVSIIIIGNLVFGVPVLGSPILLLFVSFVFIMMALSLGLLVSNIAKSQQVAMFISMFGLLLPTMLLSGFIFPIKNMPLALQYISHIIPAKYFLSALKSIMLKGLGISYIWKEISILIFMTIAFIGISIKKFKIRLDS
ncbi:MAG: ABC transporter permease [Bacteroidales bacterium]|nr:ABC transporter permease [Bacteroidales bacterium]MDD2387081.1 ABC transporter permease [Bacteroidales bacterium]MDD4217512.1 ABC transporter permease [Bacteroidales bacterium]MDY0142478.1 ABC transporter permease [Bacteroidales bacterium]